MQRNPPNVTIACKDGAVDAYSTLMWHHSGTFREQYPPDYTGVFPAPDDLAADWTWAAGWMDPSRAPTGEVSADALSRVLDLAKRHQMRPLFEFGLRSLVATVDPSKAAEVVRAINSCLECDQADLIEALVERVADVETVVQVAALLPEERDRMSHALSHALYLRMKDALNLTRHRLECALTSAPPRVDVPVPSHAKRVLAAICSLADAHGRSSKRSTWEVVQREGGLSQAQAQNAIQTLNKAGTVHRSPAGSHYYQLTEKGMRLRQL